MTERAQLVLVAAAVVAVALAPAVLAYHQLGYAADVEASEEYDAPAANAIRVLERAVHMVSVDVRANNSSANTSKAAKAVHDGLAPRIQSLEVARLAAGTVVQTGYNYTTASAWATENCPGTQNESGGGREFGPCHAYRGVVVQQRAGETHPIAVAFDVTMTTERGRTDLTVVVRSVGGAV